MPRCGQALAVKQSRPTARLAIFSAVVGFIDGCGLASFKAAGPYSLGIQWSVLLLSIATFVWFREDSMRHSFRRSALWDSAFLGLTVIVLPCYLLRSRGLKRGTLAIGVAIAIYLGYVIAVVLGAMLVMLRHA